MYEVAGCRLPYRDQAAEFHQQAGIAIENHHVPLGASQCQSQPQRRRTAHQGHAGDSQLATRQLVECSHGAHGIDNHRVFAQLVRNLTDLLCIHAHLGTSCHQVRDALPLAGSTEGDEMADDESRGAALLEGGVARHLDVPGITRALDAPVGDVQRFKERLQHANHPTF